MNRFILDRCVSPSETFSRRHEKNLRKNRKNNMFSIENRTNTIIYTLCIRFENIIISNIDIKNAVIVKCELL